jgi:mannose-6-phosphate isomerase-like protein (cupin superfamily)
MNTFTLKQIDDLAAIHGGAVKLAADELGVESFGMQVLDFPAGFADYPRHDHADDGQEEVYVVLRGQAEFEIDGHRVPLDAGSILRIPADSSRRLEPGADGVRLLAIGCTPGKPYDRPEDFRLAVRA